MKLSLHVKVIRLLLHKNWLIRSHHKLSFLLLFAIPICFAIIPLQLSGINRNRYGSTGGKQILNSSTKAIYFNRHKIINESKPIYYGSCGYRYYPTNNSDHLDIVYCPNNSYTNMLMKKASDYFTTKHWHRYEEFI